MLLFCTFFLNFIYAQSEDSLSLKYYNESKYKDVPVWFKDSLIKDYENLYVYKSISNLSIDILSVVVQTSSVNEAVFNEPVDLWLKSVATRQNKIYIVVNCSEKEKKFYQRYSYTYTVKLGALIKTHIINRYNINANRITVIGCQSKFWNEIQKSNINYKKNGARNMTYIIEK